MVNCLQSLRVVASMEFDRTPTDRVRFGAFEVDLRAAELYRNGAKLRLQEQPFQILQALLEKPGEVVTREELRERIWPADTFVDFDHGLYTAITKLREALHDSSEHPRFIETLSRRGYRFIAPVEWPSDVPGIGRASVLPHDEVSSGRAASQNAIQQKGTRGLISAGIAAAVLVLVTGAGYFLWRFARSPKSVPTSSLTRLTWDSGLTTDPALSSDGKLLAYASDRSGEGHLDIYVQQVGGSSPLRLTSGPGDKRNPAFSPDGTSIVFDSTDGGIYMVPALGGPARKLAPEGRHPQISPDGKWIAYSVGGIAGASLNTGETAVYIVALAGGVPRRVRPDFAAAIYPLWSPDGQHLLFLGNADNRKSLEEAIDWWVTPLTGGPPVKTGVLEATRRENLHGDSQAYPWALVPHGWEPDGKGIVFSARSGDSINLWRIGISPTIFKVDDPPRRLTYGAAREENPAVVARRNGGIRVAFASTSQNLAVWNLPIKPNEGKAIGRLQQLTNDAAGDFMPDVSRDGSRVVFIRVRSGNQEVWIKDLRNGQESALTASRERKYEPILSPDGSLVSFSEAPFWHVYIVPSKGGVAEMVCEGCGEATDWSADGKHILGNTCGGQAWLLDLTSRRKTDLLATRHWIATDAFSPDNRWFSFLDVKYPFRRTHIAPMRDGPVPEGAEIDIMDGEAETWSPDGNLLYATSERDGHLCIWAQRLHPSTKRPLGTPFAVFHSHNSRLSLANQTEITLSIGGSKLVFSMGERTSNIWLADWEGQ
jgi:Tol biopolymer transport system component/DNA-binding winged helix-turn-helix (wHTH) protein